MERNRLFRILMVLLILISALHLGGVLWGMTQHFGDIIVMFFLAWLLGFVLTPVSQMIEARLRVPRVLAALVVYLSLFVAILGALLLIVPTLATQIAELGQVLPTYAERAPQILADIQSDLAARKIDIDITSIYRSQEISSSLASIGSTSVQNALTLLAGAFNVLFSVILVLLLSFYIVIDGDSIMASLLQFVPDEHRGEADFFLDLVKRSFGGFLRGTLIQAVVYGVGTGVVMMLAGLEFTLVASLFAGFIMVIPVFGPFLAIVPPVGIAVASAPIQTVLLVVGGLLILQQITFNVIAPKVMSDALGLHPLLVFAALLIGGRLAGVTGAIFGVPVAAVIWAMLLQLLRRSKYGQLARERQIIVADVGPEEINADSSHMPSGTIGRGRETISRIVLWVRTRS